MVTYLIDLGWVNLAYLVASVLFIIGIKGMTHPRTAVRGNLHQRLGHADGGGRRAARPTASATTWILVGAADRQRLSAPSPPVAVQMTQMPQMVALFNGFGGAASVLVAGAAFMTAQATRRCR